MDMNMIRPVSDLRNYTDVLKDISIDSPVFLTKNGRGRYAIIDIDEYERTQAKIKIMSKLADAEQAAKKDGYNLLLDGTNASDDASDRPGMKALAELDVLSPLRLCGLTKSLIRERSRALGLPTWNKPSYACLATRIPTGEPITKEKLERTEWAETYLMGLGLSDFRVRLFADCAKLQVKEAQIPLLLQHREDILAVLRTRYDGVFLDLEVR